MTATLHPLGVGRDAGLYYTNDPAREARPRNRDEYYTRDGGGIWHSTGQSIVTHGSAVEAETFRDLCAGIHPGTGQPLVRGAGETHRAGIDITFTPGKSVSVLWMAGTAEQRDLIEAAHRAAVDRALKFLVDESLITVRYGAGGIHRAQPSDLIIARFAHFSTRAGDPNIHTHCVALNVAGSPVVSGRYASKHLTIETTSLFSAQMGLGAAYRAALAEQLQRDGFAFRPAGQGQWELAGLPQDLLELFSKRSHAIEERVGREASAAQKQVAALSTRAAKDTVLTGVALEAQWADELAQTGLDPWALATSVQPLHQRDDHALEPDIFQEPPAIAGTTPVALAASRLFLTESVLERQKLLETALVAASLQGLGPDAVYAELAALETTGHLLRLDEAHWTTAGIAATEAAMLRAANRPNEREWITAAALATALEQAAHLTPEQSAAVRAAACADGVTLIEAAAGTGKTTLAKTIVAAAERSGLTVVGLAPSWIAADELKNSTGIPAQAIARWRHDVTNGTAAPLTANTLLLLDEAGMVGTRDMAAVLTAAQAAGAKVALLGDRRQLQAVSGASPLAAIADVVERGSVLDTVRRQQVEWQRAASTLMARGDAAAGLRAYGCHERIDLIAGEAATRARVIALWTEARQRYGDGVLLVTRRNVDAMALNLEARAALQRAGALAAGEAVLPAIGRDQKRHDLPISVGEKLRFGETLPELGIRNGTRAVVEALALDPAGYATLRLRLEDGTAVTTQWSALARQGPGRKQTLPRVSHGYAGTAHASQGRTAPATILHLGRKTDSREIYVALTRHQHEARIVVEADRLDAACRQRQADPRMAPTTTAMLERLFAEAAQYREKANVIDFVSERSDFVATGLVELPQPAARWDILKTLHTARKLHSLSELVRQVWAVISRSQGPGLERKLPPALEKLRSAVYRIDGANVRVSRGPSMER
ncbi:MobF family relaxase [Devosia sp. A449]